MLILESFYILPGIAPVLPKYSTSSIAGYLQIVVSVAKRAKAWFLRQP